MGHSRHGAASCGSSHVRNAPLATVGSKKAACREGPISEIDGGLFNHLVSDGKDLVGNPKLKRLGGLEVDDEIELGRLLDWQIARFRALKNFVHIGR